MGAGHGHRLHFHGHSPVHRAPAHLKLLALLGFMLARRRHAARLVRRLRGRGAPAARCRRASRGCPCPTSRPRMVIEVPFVVFALLMPFIALGPRTEVLGLTVSEPGLHAGVALLVKGTIGRARLADPRRDHRAAGPPARPAATADARPDRPDHGLHDPLPRRGHRRARPDDGRDALPRLRPALAPALADAGARHGRAVHPLLRARRAGAPRDALARVRRPPALAGPA